MSVSFRWISSCCFLEALSLCTGVLPVCFPRNGSVLDPENWGEVSFIGDLCDSTLILCLNSGM